MTIYFKEPSAPDFSTGQIFIREENGRDRYNITMGPDGQFEQTLLPELCYTPVKPFMQLPENMFYEFIKAAATFAAERKLTLPSDTHLKGRMEATEKHLEDVRGYFQTVLQKLVAP